MGKLLDTAKAHVGATVIGVAMLGGAGVATAAVVVEPASTQGVYRAPSVETSQPVPTSAPQELAPSPVAPVQEQQAATVETMSEPAPQPAPAAAPAPVEPNPAPAPSAAPSSTWNRDAPYIGDEAGNTYVPAPEPPIEKLPSEIDVPLTD